MEEKIREQIRYVRLWWRVGQRVRRLKIERGPRKEDKKWEKGVSLKVRGRDTITA